MARAAKKKTELKVVGGHGEIGHNSSGAGETLTDDQMQSLFLRHKTKIGGLKEKIASLTGELRSVYKEAKSDGFTKKEIDFAFELEKDEDDKVIERRRRESMIAKWMNHPLGTQADLFLSADMTDRRPLKERAFDEGKRAAMEGKECKPPHDGGDGHEGWVEGWHAGAAVVNNQKKEQEDGERLLRPVQNEASGPDEFDTAGEESFLNDEQEAPAEPVSPEPDPWDEPNDGAAADEKWPDDVAVEGAREEPEEL